MPIESYVPPKQEIIDHRNPNGGFYNAICDVCGTRYYPRRANARYCTPHCAQTAWHKRERAGTNPKRKTKKQNSETNVFLGRGAVVNFFRDKSLKTHGLLVKLKGDSDSLYVTWENHNIEKISATRYVITPV